MGQPVPLYQVLARPQPLRRPPTAAIPRASPTLMRLSGPATAIDMTNLPALWMTMATTLWAFVTVTLTEVALMAMTSYRAGGPMAHANGGGRLLPVRPGVQS